MTQHERWRNPKPGWVKDMEDALAEYYNEPVRPVSQYCDAFRTWEMGLSIHAQDDGKTDFREESLKKAAEATVSLQLPISKSSYLARRIYDGERHRTKRCPEHKGHWCGLEWGENRCPHGCNLTGWIYEGKDGDEAS